MTIDQLKAPRFLILALPLVLFIYGDAAQAQKKTPYACKELLPHHYALQRILVGRSSEIVLLRIRCQKDDPTMPGTSDTLPADAVCLLDVPANRSPLP
jgi:hypothetical protein